MKTAINNPAITIKSRKPRSKFALLPPEDQKRVIELCDQHTYHALPSPFSRGVAGSE